MISGSVDAEISAALFTAASITLRSLLSRRAHILANTFGGANYGIYLFEAEIKLANAWIPFSDKTFK